MQILAITSQKGGVGKTTLTMNLAIAAAANGVPTIVFDLDPQASAMSWYDRRVANGHPDQPKVVSIQAVRLPHELKNAISDGYELAIIDTPPNVSGEAVHIAQAGDLILIPVQPSILDLDAVRTSISISKQSDRPAVAVMNGCQHRRKVIGQGIVEASTTQESRRLIEEDLEFPVLSQTICDRVDYKYSAIDGLGVIEYEPDGKASEEIISLWKLIHAALKDIRKQEQQHDRKEAVNG